MNTKKITVALTEFENLEELSSQDRSLMIRAIEARKNAYAPYSSFNVGAAIRLENGEVVIGNNQENASYPSGLCAERVAVFQAGARFPKVVIEAIAISAASENHEVTTPAAPCGNCRQSISEYEFRQKKPISIFMMGKTGKIVKSNSIADLLPMAFDGTLL